MRDARAADWLRRLSTRQADWCTKIHRVALQSIPSISELEILIQSPLTVLAGANGVGKTTLLRTIWAALEPLAAGPVVAASKKLTAGTALIELTVNGANEKAEVNFGTDEMKSISRASANVQHVDGAAYTTKYQPGFCRFESSEDLINGEGGLKLDSKSLAEVSYILNRSYRSVTVYEVDLDGVVPFFEVDYGNDRYDSRTMGNGEMAALYIWWALNRALNNSIILIEEPEAYLSHGCQASLANHVIKVVVEKKLVAVVSSHAPAFISPMPKPCLVFLTRGPAGVALVADEAPPALLAQLGIHIPVLAIVYVEDSLARLTCLSILEKFDPQLSRQIHISQRNGDGEIIISMKPKVDADSPLKFIALFDGDLRGSVPEAYRDRSAFLPGSQPMEIEFRQMLVSHPDGLEAHGNANIPAILASLEGKDHHDWYEELGRELSLSRDQLFYILFKFWINISGSLEACEATYRELESLIHPSRRIG